MALPAQLKSARMTDATVGANIDDHVGDLEQVLCDIFGFTIDTNVTESPLDCDNSGRITKALLRLVAAGPVGIRFRNTTTDDEFRLVLLDTGHLSIEENTGTEGAPVWNQRAYMAISNGVMVFDGLPRCALDPTLADELTRKSYVEALDAAILSDVLTTQGDLMTRDGSDVIRLATGTAGQVLKSQGAGANLVWGDATAGAVAHLWCQKAQGTAGDSLGSASWADLTLTNEEDPNSIVTLAANEFTLAAGTYLIEANVPLYYAAGQDKCRIRLKNVTDTSYIYFNSGGVSVYGMAHLSTIVTIAASKDFILQGYGAVANMYAGAANNLAGIVEKYQDVRITQLA